MISVHLIPSHWGEIGGVRDADIMARWRPEFIKIVCVDERPPYAEQMPTSAKLIIRNHPMSELYGTRGLTSTTAVSVGSSHAIVCARMADYLVGRGIARNRLLFEGLNEPNLWGNEESADVALYYQGFLVGLHNVGLHGVVGNFGVGWPGNGGVADAPVDWAFFNPVIATMRDGDYLGLHEYWNINGPGENWTWWGGRFLQCPYDVPILITECGVDTGVVGKQYGGWRDMLPNATFDEKARRYVDDLWWYCNKCRTDDPKNRVRAIFPFTYDIGSPDWFKFNIRDTVWLVAFWNKVTAEGLPDPGVYMPSVPDNPIPAVPVADIRNAAWNKLNIPYNPSAAFPTKARALKLGNPVTVEFDVSGYRAQGYAGGILYAKIGDWSNIRLLPW